MISWVPQFRATLWLQCIKAMCLVDACVCRIQSSERWQARRRRNMCCWKWGLLWREYRRRWWSWIRWDGWVVCIYHTKVIMPSFFWFWLSVKEMWRGKYPTLVLWMWLQFLCGKLKSPRKKAKCIRGTVDGDGCPEKIDRAVGLEEINLRSIAHFWTLDSEFLKFERLY